MFFYISKIAWLLIQPAGLLALCLVAIVLVTRRRSRAGAVLSVLALLLLLSAGQTNLGRLALQPLENRFSRPATPPPAEAVAGIIVLGGGFDGHVTRTRGGFELGEAGDRFVEALRLARLYPDAPVVVTGGEASLIGRTEGDAPIATRFFSAFGIAPGRVVLESRSLNTYENATLTKPLLPASPGRWLLVTSAFHMPRAMGVFRKQDIPVIAWPVDYRTSGEETFRLGRDDPAEAFAELSLAMREWTGLVAYAATGRTSALFPR